MSRRGNDAVLEPPPPPPAAAVHSAREELRPSAGVSESTPPRDPHGGGATCWICHDPMSTPEDPLVSGLCLCRGSVGWVHQTCINQWVLSQRRLICPSCGASYNIVVSSNVASPSTCLMKVVYVVRHLVFPLLFKTFLLTLCIAANGLIIPCFIGVAYYHRSVFGLPANPLLLPPLPVADVGQVNSSSSCEDSVGRSGPCATAIGGDTAAQSDLQGLWLWTTVLLFGWLCVTLLRGMRSGWRQWRAFFNRGQIPVELPLPPPFTMVEYAHWFLDVSLQWCGCSRQMFYLRFTEVAIFVPIAFALSHPMGKQLALLLFVGVAIAWRLVLPRKRIRDPALRVSEAQEGMENATDCDIALWFITYVCEMTLFSIVMPICAGIVVNLGLGPFLTSLPASPTEFLDGLSIIWILGYWCLGTVCSMTLMQVEAKLIVPLFAPGIDLYFIRSVDINLEGDAVYWNFILAQIYDADPLRIIFDFLRMSLIELSALYIFISFPLRAAFALHLGTDGKSRIELPLPSGFPTGILSPYNGTLETHFAGSPLAYVVNGFQISLPRNGTIAHCANNILWLVMNSTIRRWASNILVVLGSGTIIVCLKTYPLQRIQLQVLRPLVMGLATYVFCMEAFMFDPERNEIVDIWLRGNGQGELDLPAIPLGALFLRRERAVPPNILPRFLKPRMMLFSALFFILSTALFWGGPVVIMSLLLFFLPFGVPLVCGSLSLFLFLVNPSLYCSALVEFILVLLILVVGLFMHPLFMCAPLLHISFQQLLQETMEYSQPTGRTVGLYAGERTGAVDFSSDFEYVTTESEEEREETTTESEEEREETTTESEEEVRQEERVLA